MLYLSNVEKNKEFTYEPEACCLEMRHIHTHTQCSLCINVNVIHNNFHSMILINAFFSLKFSKFTHSKPASIPVRTKEQNVSNLCNFIIIFETSYNIYKENLCWENVTMNLDGKTLKNIFAIVNLKLARGQIEKFSG